MTGLLILTIAVIHLFFDQKVNYCGYNYFIIVQPFFRILGEKITLNQDINLQIFFDNQIISSNFLRRLDFYSSKGYKYF